METKQLEIIKKLLEVISDMPQTSSKEKLLKLIDELINSL